MITNDSSGGPIGGSSDPRCPCATPAAGCPGASDGKIHIFDCDLNGEDPPVCYDGNDVEIGTAMKDANGNWFDGIAPAPGHVIYATDGCFNPERVGPFTVIKAPAVAPLLSPEMLVALVAILSVIGLFGLSRLRFNK